MKAGLIFCLILLLACGEDHGIENVEETGSTEIKTTKNHIVSDTSAAIQILSFDSEIDEKVEFEMRQFLENGNELDSFEIYAISETSEENWSELLWGRCCTEADLQYAEIMAFLISVNHDNKNYPFKNLLDNDYNTAFAFKSSENIEITIKLEPNSFYFEGKKSPGQLLNAKDTIVSPFQITVINGYVKSKETYLNNARVKTFELWKNNEFYGMINLQDSPRPQRFLTDFPFFKDDIIILKPIDYYPGKKYDDVCLSAVQYNLGGIAHHGINEKYVFSKLWE